MSVDVLYPAKEENARTNEPETRLESLRNAIRERAQKEREQMNRNPWVPILFNWVIAVLIIALVIAFVGWGVRIHKDRRDEAMKAAAREEAVASYIAAQNLAAENEYEASGQKAKDEARKANAIALAKDSGIWKNEAAFKTHCWNVILRVKSPLYPDSIQAVLTQAKQYEYANLDADTYQTEKVQWATEVLEQAERGEVDPLTIMAQQYDLVINGYESASGAVRNHDPEIMVKAFELVRLDEEAVKSKFPAMYNAFCYGAPPHAGAAPGIDRLIMLLAGEDSIREIIPFPMNKNAQDVMMGAPGEVTQKQLDELHILTKPEE